MPVAINNSSALRQPDTTRKAAPVTSATTTAPGPRHVRIHRGETVRGTGVEHVIGRPSSAL